MMISVDGSLFLIFSLLCLLLKQNPVFCGLSPTTDLSPNLILFLENTGYTFPLINRTDVSFQPQMLRSKRDADFVYLDDVREFLQQEDYVSAILNYIELTHNRSDSLHCARTSLKAHFKYDLPDQSLDRFERQAAAAIKTANILTNLFLKDSGDTEMIYNEEFYYSLVRVNVESDPFIYASGIGFQRGVFRPRGKIPPLLFTPYAFRQDGYIETKDLATAYNVSYDEDSIGSEWFWQPIERNFTDQRKNNTNFSVASTPLVSGGSDIIVGLSDGRWTSPYLECNDAGNKWLISFSAPFFGRQENTINFRGVAVISIDLKYVDINQCAEDESMFAGTHKCNTESTECIHISGKGFRRGAYKCQCRRGYYFPKSYFVGRFNGDEQNSFLGSEVENAFVASRVRSSSVESSLIYPDHFRCLPCKPGCITCVDDTSCFAEYNMLLRSVALGLQSFCTTITVVVSVVVFRLRKSKQIACSMWIMLEAMLFGSLLLYQTVVVRYFEPSLVTCLAEPWFRELGFAIFYGSIVLKVYRILAEFQSRKAHRVCVRDKDLLKYLLGIVLVVMCYMAAWTAVVMDNITRGHDIIDQHETLDGLKYFTCRALWWDYVTEGGEFLFLLLGIYLTYCIRNARKEFYREKWPLSAAICIETVVSVTTHTVRRVMWLSLGQDYLFFLHFLRCQLTVTCILTLIFGPKLWYHHRPSDPNRHLSCDIQDYVPDSLKLHEAIMSNGEVDLVEINLTDMDPEDIRAELRRVYTQLQALRNKTMRKDNPHISKRRGGRKVTHRRFSLQPFHHKHKPHHDHDHEITEVSKTPEDSVASIEVAPGQIEGTSTRNDDVVSTPTVSFKTGLK